jgi:hypothetical protein
MVPVLKGRHTHPSAIQTRIYLYSGPWFHASYRTSDHGRGREMVVKFKLKSTVFWDITPCCPLKVNRRFGGTYCLNLQGRAELCCFTLVSSSANSSTLKMEAIWSFETSADFQRTTRRYIPEDGTLHNHRCENLKCYITFNLFNTIFNDRLGVFRI